MSLSDSEIEEEQQQQQGTSPPAPEAASSPVAGGGSNAGKDDDNNSSSSRKFNLHLDGDVDEDEDAGGGSGNIEDQHPRRLVKIGRHVVAYGAKDGSRLVEVIADAGGSARLSGREIDHHKGDFDPDDAVRAVGVSDDGRRVVVGFDGGSTLVYAYDGGEDGDVDLDNSGSHPFVVDKSEDSAPSSGRTTKPWTGPRLEGSIRDVAFCPGSYRVAIASEGTGFFVVDVTSKSGSAGDEEDRLLEDECQRHHDYGGVRGLAFGQVAVAGAAGGGRKTILASLAMDGRLCLWDCSSSDGNDWDLLEREDMRCITKKDVGEILGSDPFDRSCRPHFLTSSNMFALPGECSLQLRSFETAGGVVKAKRWDTSSADNNEAEDGSIQGHIQSIVAVAASPKKKDRHLVTSGRDGRVILWEIVAPKKGGGDEEVSARFVRQLGTYDTSPPTDVMWDVDTETGTESLLIACADGYLHTIQGRANIVPPPSSASNSKVGSSGNLKEAHSPSRQQQGHRFSKKSGGNKAALPSEDDDDDDELFNSDQPSPPKNRFLEDEAAEEDDNQPPSPPKAASNPNGRDSQDSDDEDDGGFDYVKEFRQQQESGRLYESSAIAAAAPKLPDPQPAFAPSSTPLDLKRRFLCWNHVGSCTHLQGDAGVLSSVDIDFTDSAFRRPVSFPDNLGFILGSLGEEGALFATDVADDDDDDDDDDNLDDDEDIVVSGLSETTRAALKRSRKSKDKQQSNKPTGSTLFFYRWETFGALRDKDWYLTLPDGERALGCACGEGWAAVMTSRRFLRTFTSGGNQGRILWLPGEPVTMVGRSRYLAVFYHEAPPLLDGTQKLGYTFYDAIANKVIAKGSTSCTSSGASLIWAGISNDCSLMAMDSDGMVSMLVSSPSIDGATDVVSPPSWEWAPVLDTVGLRKSSDDSYWPVTAYDGKLISVLLKGGIKHPDSTRRPVTTALGLRLPLARGSLANTNALEELSVRADISLNHKRIFHDLASGGVEDEEFESEYHALSAQVDKVTLKMFAGIVEAGKLERALDLVERLHLEKSYDLAMTIADNHQKLADLIEDAKDRKFGGPPPVDDEPAYTEDDGGAYTGYDDDEPADDHEDSHQRITPDSSSARKRSMAEFSSDAGPRETSRLVRRKQAFA